MANADSVAVAINFICGLFMAPSPINELKTRLPQPPGSLQKNTNTPKDFAYLP